MSTIWNGGLHNLHLKSADKPHSMDTWFTLSPFYAGWHNDVIV